MNLKKVIMNFRQLALGIAVVCAGAAMANAQAQFYTSGSSRGGSFMPKVDAKFAQTKKDITSAKDAIIENRARIEAGEIECSSGEYLQFKNSEWSCVEEEDPQVGTLTSGKWCRAVNGKVVCDQSDPQVEVEINVQDFAKKNYSFSACASGQVLTTSASGSSLVCVDDAGGSADEIKLGDLNDVNTAGAVNGKFLYFNGSTWVAQVEQDPSVQEFAQDGYILTPCAPGHVITSVTHPEGTRLTCTPDKGGISDALQLSDLSDVEFDEATPLVDSDFMGFDGTKWTARKELDPNVMALAKDTYGFTACAATEILSTSADGKQFTCIDTSSLSVSEIDPTVETFAKTVLPNCTAGQVLSGAGGVLSCVNDAGGAADALSLNDLSDVALGAAINGDMLQYNGTSWSASAEDDPNVENFAKNTLPTCGVDEVLKGNGTSLSCVFDAGSDGSGGYWSLNGVDIYYNAGGVGVGTNTPDSQLQIVGTGTTNATNALHVVNQGAAKSLFKILDDGNIGIGTVSPTEALEIAGQNRGLAINPDDGTTDWYLGAKSNTHDIYLDRKGVDSLARFGGDGSITFNSRGGLPFLINDNSLANVGIATAAPTAQLDVSGTIRISNGNEVCDGNFEGGVRYVSATDSLEFCQGASWQAVATSSSIDSTKLVDSDGDTQVQTEANTDDDTIRFSTADFERMVIAADGTVGIGMTPANGAFSVYQPAVGASGKDSGVRVSTVSGVDSRWFEGGATDIGIGTQSNHSFSLRANGTTAMFIQPDHDIGIGTSTPAVALDVSGTLRVSNGAEACAAGTAGGIRYASNNIEYCNGTAWESLASSSSVNFIGLSDTPANYTGVARQFPRVNAGETGLEFSTIAVNDLSDGKTTTNNIFVGTNSGNALTSGTRNSALGFTALENLTSGLDNTAIGFEALKSQTDGSANTAIGAHSLSNQNNTSDNTALGAYALFSSTFSGYNTAVGSSAMHDNTSGDQNTSIGYRSLRYNRTGVNNFAAGAYAGHGSTNASNVNNNIFIGSSSGQKVLTGADNNVFIGHQSGNDVTTGTSNILIGYDVDAPAATTSSHLNIGNTLYGDLATGKIGVGIVAPAVSLDVSGTIRISNGAETCVAGTAGGLRYNGGEIERCNGTAWEALAVAANIQTDFIADADNDTKVQVEESADDDAIRFDTAGSERMIINAAGRIGVGVSAPATKTALDVAGLVKVGSNNAETCDADHYGTMRWNTVANRMQVCRP